MLRGEMAEWLMALVLKTSDPARDRGFESLSLRQSNHVAIASTCVNVLQ